MRLPEIAEELRALAARHGLQRLSELADEIRRRRPLRRAPTTSARMTPALEREIVEHVKAHPTETFAEVGRRFNVNAGRVSEAVRGFRR